MLIKRLYSLILVIIILTTFISKSVVASGTFSVYHNFEKNPAYQGDLVTVTITITNDDPDQCRITWLGIHLDWQSDNIYTTCGDVSEDNPEAIASGDTETFQIVIEVPSNVLTGNHAYNILFCQFHPNIHFLQKFLNS